MLQSPCPVESSVRVYDLLVKAYPPSFRRQYQDEMTLVFREFMTDAWRERGVVRLAAAWFRVLGDLARTVPREHFHELRRRLEMKRAAMVFLSMVVAGLSYAVFFFVGAAIALFPLIAGVNRSRQGAFLLFGIALVVMYLAAFLTGLILTQIKRLVAPSVTVPLGAMGSWGLWGLAVFLDDLWRRGMIPDVWIGLAIGIGAIASVGLATYFGCHVATKARDRLARLAVPWYQLIWPLAVLICASFTACTIRLVLLCHGLEPDVRQILSLCVLALFLVSAATIASVIVLFVRAYRRAVVQ